MEYRSIAELNDQVVDWIDALPRDLDLIVGIPRSGMLPGRAGNRLLRLTRVVMGPATVAGLEQNAGLFVWPAVVM